MDFDATSLLSSLLISCIGGGIFLYGKKMQRVPPLIAGLGLCAFPYFVSTLWMWIISGAVVGGLYFFRQR